MEWEVAGSNSSASEMEPDIKINNFSKTICTICYDDLKPIVEDLQAISICGHVFHELCLQQWFEYCPSGKKTCCPVCKQHCSQKSVSRLFFQSISSESTPSNLSQNPSLSTQPNVGALRAETVKLQGQLSVLNQAFECQQQYLKELNKELSTIKERAERETTLKLTLLKEKTDIQQMLQKKTEELTKSTTECSRLQERSMALAKELSAHKLVSDLDLDEEEVLRLASVGRGTSVNDIIDVLKKSLILRNKSYKELMAQCNLLGRGESRSVKKLEKAVEKMKKLRTRLQEVERVLEEKDNKASRVPKLYPRISKEAGRLSGLNMASTSTPAPIQNIIDVGWEMDDCVLIHAAHAATASSPNLRESSDGETGVIGCSDYNSMSHWNGGNNNFDKDVVEIIMPQPQPNLVAENLLPDILKDSPLLPINKGTSGAQPDPFSFPGDQPVLGGLLGSIGMDKHVGKWCRNGQNEVSLSGGVQRSAVVTGDLVAVGSDGRGGRIKVLRSQKQFMGERERSLWEKQTKRCKSKSGVKQSGRSQGCLQIDHFFQKQDVLL